MTQRYTPTEPIPNHDGSAGDPASDYFVPPSAQIGEVLSASTTHTTAGPRPISRHGAEQRWVESLAWGVGAGVIVGAAAYAANDFGLVAIEPQTAAFLGGGAGSVALVAAFFVQALPRRFSSYVGRLGCQVSRGSSADVCSFERCDGITTSLTDESENGVYRQTLYRYEIARRGERPLVIAGRYHRDHEDLAAESRFARAAEAAWMAYRWPIVDASLGAGEAVSFEAGPFRLEVRSTGIDIREGSRTVHVAREDIAGVSSAQGWLVLKKRGAERYAPSVLFTRKRGWVERGLVWQIAAAEVRDLPLLQRALETHLGITGRP